MKKSFISLLSTMLALLMICGILCSSLAACTGKEETTGTSGSTTTGNNTEATETTDKNGDDDSSSESGEAPDGTESTFEDEVDSSESDNEADDSDNSSDSSNGTEKEEGTDEETDDFVGPTLEKDGQFADSIKYSQQMLNGVQSYYTESTRNNYRVENLNMNLLYSLKKGKNVSSITNKNGGVYIQDTMDVFVTKENGTTFYSSGSGNNIRPNIYRLGYYYYDVHLLEHDFAGDVNIAKVLELDEKIFSYKSAGVTNLKESKGELTVRIGGGDPYIVMADGKDRFSYSASDYNAIQFTIQSEHANGVQIYYINDTMSGHNDTANVKYSISNDGEYHTYTVMLSGTAEYTGEISRIRIDFDGTVANEIIKIKDIKLVNAEVTGFSNLFLDRTLHTYSDKLHQELHFVASQKVTGIKEVGMVTKIAADTVDKLIVKDSAKDLHTTLEGVDWATAEYVGFDIKNVGIFGYILPVHENAGTITVELVGDNYVITQRVPVKDGTINPVAVDNPETNKNEAKETNTTNDFYTGNRIYTDDSHSFDKFILEANWEREPIKAISSEAFISYEALRGAYSFEINGTGFNGPFFYEQNYHYNISAKIRSEIDRPIYIRTITSSGCLENAVVLDSNNLVLPIMTEVSKNFGGEDEEPLFFAGDMTYGETIFPLLLTAGERLEFSVINLYQNWGNYPLKQLSSIQYFWPYYHLSVGTTETSCISPWYGATDLWTLPDFRSQSMPYWFELEEDKGYSNQPQHTHAGYQYFLQYTDANGAYSATENISNVIDSSGPIYVDVEMTYISDDGKIKVNYNHIEMPQEDELRAYYEIEYEILEEVTINDFRNNFSFYSFEGYSGKYRKMGYLNENGECVTKATNLTSTPETIILGKESPYVSLFDLNATGSWANNNANLGLVIYNSEFIFGGEKLDENFVIVGANAKYSLSLNVDSLTLKPGDTMKLNIIVMPWGHYDSTNDNSVRSVRENSCLNPLTVEVSKGEKIESVYVPKVLSTDGKSAEFTLSGGTDNVVVRAYGFKKLTAPKIYELVNGEYVDDGNGGLVWNAFSEPTWVEYTVSSINNPDKMGNKHYYDGYYVYYDGNGSYSYAFVVDMTDAESRTFKVVAEEDFKKWPVINDMGTDAPLNVFVGAPTLYTMTNGAIKGIGKTELSEGADFVRYYGDGLGTGEAYFEIFRNTNEIATGKYAVIKYRIPNSTKENNRFEFYTTTDPSADMTACGVGAGTLYKNGDWHIMVVDLVERGAKHYAPKDGGEEYYAQYFRLDIFNTPMSASSYIDIAYIGLTDDVAKVLELEKSQTNACDEVRVFGKDNKYVVYDLEGNVIEGKEIIQGGYIAQNNNRDYKNSNTSYISGIDYVNGIGDGDPNDPAFNSYRSHEVAGPKEIVFDGPTTGNAYLALAGWTCVYEGIEKFVWSADGGVTWYDCVLYPDTKNFGAASGGIKTAADSHFSSQVAGFDKDTYDQTYYANSVYQGSANTPVGIAAHLVDYIGKEVGVTFAAVPKNDPQGLCIIAHVSNVRVYESDAAASEGEKCTHTNASNFVYLDDNDPNTDEAIVKMSCKCGEVVFSTSKPNFVLFIGTFGDVNVAPTAPDHTKPYMSINAMGHLVSGNTKTFAANSNGELRITGWGGLVGGIKDVVFKVFDSTGNELTKGWTAANANLTIRGDISGEMTKRGIFAGDGRGVDFTLYLARYIKAKDDVVTVTLAYVATGAPEGSNDKYVKICDIINVKVPAEPVEYVEPENPNPVVPSPAPEAPAVTGKTFIAYFDSFMGSNTVAVKASTKAEAVIYNVLPGASSGDASITLAGWAGVYGGATSVAYKVTADGSDSEWVTLNCLSDAASDVEGAVQNSQSTIAAEHAYRFTAVAKLDDYVGKSVIVTFALVSADDGTYIPIFVAYNLGVACDHTVINPEVGYTFVDDGDANTEEAKIASQCICGKNAPAQAPSYVIFFQDVVGATSIGNQLFSCENSKGYRTIDCNEFSLTTSETGTLTASGWGGMNGGIADIVFKVYDANGNELTSGWTTAGATMTARADIASEMNKRQIEVSYGKGYSFTLDLAKYISAKDQVLTVKLAYVAEGAPEDSNDKYVYLCDFINLKVPAEPAK